MYLYIDINILYIVLYTSILYSFVNSKSKIKFFSKSIFIITFWSWISLAVILFITHGNIIETLLEIFLLNYLISSWDFYSELDESNSKEILNSLIDLLKKIDLIKFDLGKYNKPGGGGPDPDIIKYLHLNSEHLKELRSWNIQVTSLFDFNSPEAIDISSRIDAHNNSLIHPKEHEVSVKELRAEIVRHKSYVDYHHHHPYGIAGLGGNQNEIDYFKGDFFKVFSIKYRAWMIHEINQYNFLTLCKVYYDALDKSELPDKLEYYWNQWRSSQIGSYDLSYHEKKLISSTGYIHNFFNEDVSNFELNDNLLIIGVSILCKDYVITNLTEWMSDNETLCSKVAFYKQAWLYYEESLVKYKQFYDHYNHYVNKLKLDKYTLDDLKTEIERNKLLSAKLASMPPLEEGLFNLDNNPSWFNNIRCVDYSAYKGLLGSLSTTKLATFDSKVFYNGKTSLVKFIPKSVWSDNSIRIKGI